jgi:hypothetical protein
VGSDRPSQGGPDWAHVVAECLAKLAGGSHGRKIWREGSDPDMVLLCCVRA